MQRDLIAPPMFYVNCTPGGEARHLAVELEAAKFSIKPSYIYLLAGTNNAGQDLYKIRNSFQKLILAAKKKFPETPVSYVLKINLSHCITFF